MKERSIASFLIRVEERDGGGRGGMVTSVQTGEHVSFDALTDLARILDRLVTSAAPPKGTHAAADPSADHGA